MLDRVIEQWRAVPFARILVAEHARDHELPKGVKRLDFGETFVTLYRSKTR